MKSLFFVLITIFSLKAAAKETFPAQGRVFIGSTEVKAESLNQEMRVQGFKEFNPVSFYGAEITYSLIRYLDIGFNYKRRDMDREENSVTNPIYKANLKQDALQFIGRVPFLRTNILRLDAFAGAGVSNTQLSVRSPTQDGEMQTNEWGSLVTSYGASGALGYKKFFLFIEGGFENNKPEKFKRTGNINSNISAIDISGSYISIGLMFDGVTASRN